MSDPTIPIAFAAGLVSFASPCVLPLVPGYLSYMSGFSANNEGGKTLAPWAAALGFVAGFTIVFVALGATATLLGSLLRDHQRVLVQISGALIIVLGLVFMGVLKVPFLYREARFRPTPTVGMWGSVVLGGAFAFGWSPCIGAVMGAVLAMAAGNASSGGVLKGAGLLAVYSAGLGVPFILAGLGMARLTTALKWLRTHIRTLNLVSGALLVIVGILFVTDQMFQLSVWMQRTFVTMGLDFWKSF
ncbi:MAG TPA: cytochrome c biogenesis protein CcdA [Actinomycetota bacterium]|nr:cytochrome c biogenesis protein CcdA [Actinomycetota bacterium]